MPITVYGQPSCPQCTATTRKLEAVGADFKYIDVSQDHEARAYIQGLGYQGVPVIEQGDQHFKGYRPDALMGMVG